MPVLTDLIKGEMIAMHGTGYSNPANKKCPTQMDKGLQP
jgi:hypothetical protein